MDQRGCMKQVEDRDFNVPKMVMRTGKGGHNSKKHREKFKQFIKTADLTEEDYDDFEWEEE